MARLGRRTSRPLLRYLRPFERSYGVLRSSTAQRAGAVANGNVKGAGALRRGDDAANDAGRGRSAGAALELRACSHASKISSMGR